MAQDQSSLGLYDFLYSRFLLEDRFGLYIQEDLYLEKAYNIFRTIGNIAMGVYSFEFTVDDSCEVQLPCNVEFIEAVKFGRHWDGLPVHDAIPWMLKYDSYSDIPSLMLNSSYFRERRHSNLYAEGEFKRYNLELGGDVGTYKLTFEEGQIGTSGIVKYRGMLVDNDGNPLINLKEAEAIAYQMAYHLTMKDAFKRDPAAVNLLPFIKQEAGVKMAAAKIPEYITQNQWDQILTAASSHDRKVFWSSSNSIK